MKAIVPRKAVWRSLAVAVLAAGVGACGRSEAAPNQAQQGGQAGGQRGGGGPFGGRGGGLGGPPAVETEAVIRGSIARNVTVSGVVEPIRTVGVNSQASGALLTVEVEEGAMVAQGGVLARVDQRELEAQMASAEASFQVAEAAYKRAEQLRERQVITLPEYERDRTAYAAARAQLEQLRTRIGYATVRSPIRGVIVEKSVEAGDVVGSQTRLFSVADVSTLVVRVGVSELDVVELRVGAGARASLDAFPGRQLRGRIRRVFPAADPATRLVPVEVALEAGSDQLVKPGFLARITFDLSTREGVLLVNDRALAGGGGARSVFVVENGRAVRRTVETGLTSAGRVEIVSGLDEGDVVVVVGNNALRDGGDVRVMSGPGAGAAPAAGGGEGRPGDGGRPGPAGGRSAPGGGGGR